MDELHDNVMLSLENVERVGASPDGWTVDAADGAVAQPIGSHLRL